MDKFILYFRPKQLKDHILSRRTYLNRAYFSNEVSPFPRDFKVSLEKMERASAVCLSISAVLSILTLSMNNEAAALKLQKCKLTYVSYHPRILKGGED